MPGNVVCRRVFFAALLYLLFTAFPASAQDILLKQVHLIDPARQQVSEGNILIHNGRIQKISATAPAGFKGQTFDLSGKWIVPGFSDMHVHSTWNPAQGMQQSADIENTAKLMLFSGVTAYLDLFSDEDQIFQARDSQREQGAAASPAADIFAAGPLLTCTGGHGTDFLIRTRVMDTPKEARHQVSLLAAKRPDVIKLAYDHARDYKSMDKATMRAVVAEANTRGIKTVVHIGNWKDAQEAVEAGASVITHLYETEIPDALAKKMAAKGVWEIPTMVYQTEVAHLVENPGILSSPLLVAAASPELLDMYRRLNLSLPYVQNLISTQKKNTPFYFVTLRKLDQAGVRLMTGTDSGNLAAFHGFGVHREMAIYVEAGLSTWKALAAATTAPRKFLHRPSGISIGDLADLVVLEGSPIDDIRNTQGIRMVIHDGKVIDREALVPKRAVSSGAEIGKGQ